MMSKKRTFYRNGKTIKYLPESQVIAWVYEGEIVECLGLSEHEFNDDPEYWIERFERYMRTEFDSLKEEARREGIL